MANSITPGMEGVALRTSLNEVITESNTTDTRNYWAGKKAVFIGDSQTAQGDDAANSWILTLCGLMGWTYVAGDQNMGVAGSGLMPYTNLPTVGDFSIYKRCADVAAKNPDIIFLLGGENDDPNLPINTAEATYTGATLPTGDPGLPGIIGAYKGCLKKLRDGSPNATIVSMTNMVRAADGETTNQKKINRHLAFQQVCGLFNVTFLPLYQVQGITDVHPPPSEGEIIGKWIARKMYSV